MTIRDYNIVDPTFSWIVRCELFIAWQMPIHLIWKICHWNIEPPPYIRRSIYISVLWRQLIYVIYLTWTTSSSNPEVVYISYKLMCAPFWGTIFLIRYRLYYYVCNSIYFGHPPLWYCLRAFALVLLIDLFRIW